MNFPFIYDKKLTNSENATQQLKKPKREKEKKKDTLYKVNSHSFCM